MVCRDQTDSEKRVRVGICISAYTVWTWRDPALRASAATVAYCQKQMRHMGSLLSYAWLRCNPRQTRVSLVDGKGVLFDKERACRWEWCRTSAEDRRLNGRRIPHGCTTWKHRVRFESCLRRNSWVNELARPSIGWARTSPRCHGTL